MKAGASDRTIRSPAPWAGPAPVQLTPGEKTVPRASGTGGAVCSQAILRSRLESGRVHLVVNHLHLRDPVPPEIVEKAHDAVRSVVDAGGRAAHVAKVDDRHLVLILVFDSPEDAARVAREVGGPWMRENIVPLLDRDTERSVGEIIASAEA